MGHVTRVANAGARGLPPNAFAMVMATGIVSVALHGVGFTLLAEGLFWVNVALFALLLSLLLLRLLCHRAALVTDLRNHAKAPGFFTLVAGPCILGNQCVLLHGAIAAGFGLWLFGVAWWLVLSYLLLPSLMEGTEKMKPEAALSGGWLILVVGTQAVSVLASRLVRAYGPEPADLPLFVALAFWLVGSMLYLWLIALIFHRILFLPLSASDLTPPYWINMGAMAISTLAGVCLVGEAERMVLLKELLPFVKGMTLLFWATATWWIPILLALGVWRHVVRRLPLRYDHGYWPAVFPLGMYTVCTQNLSSVFGLSFLAIIPAVFVWVAAMAWGTTFTGLVHYVISANVPQAIDKDTSRHHSDGIPSK